MAIFNSYGSLPEGKCKIGYKMRYQREYQINNRTSAIFVYICINQRGTLPHTKFRHSSCILTYKVVVAQNAQSCGRQPQMLNKHGLSASKSTKLVMSKWLKPKKHMLHLYEQPYEGIAEPVT